MEYIRLGRTGLTVSRLCVGTMNFGWQIDEQQSHTILDRAIEGGLTFVDTANMYGSETGDGLSERFIGSWFDKSGHRDNVVLATKVHGQMGVPVGAPAFTQGDPNQRGNSRRWIVREVENSLRRLGTDWIDLYQIHRPDPGTDHEETLGALTDLQRQGKIRAFGSSTYPAEEKIGRAHV